MHITQAHFLLPRFFIILVCPFKEFERKSTIGLNTLNLELYHCLLRYIEVDPFHSLKFELFME